MVVGGPAYGESSKVMNFSPANATCIMHMQEKKKRKINKPENGGGGFFFDTDASSWLRVRCALQSAPFA